MQHFADKESVLYTDCTRTFRKHGLTQIVGHKDVWFPPTSPMICQSERAHSTTSRYSICVDQFESLNLIGWFVLVVRLVFNIVVTWHIRAFIKWTLYKFNLPFLGRVMPLFFSMYHSRVLAAQWDGEPCTFKLNKFLQQLQI